MKIQSGYQILSRIVYSVTNTLTGCQSLNSANTANWGSSYNATITADSGYTLTGASVTVLMGGTNITESAYDNGVISIAKVTGNIVITVSAILVYNRTFGNNTPDVIAAVSEEIANNNYTAAQVATIYGWNLGDTVDITLTTNEVIQMQIIGVNHDTLSSDHTSKAGLTLQMKNCLNTLYAMNSTDTNAGGWQGSVMRTTTLPAVYATLPSEWQNVIKLVDKKAANGGGTNYTETVTTSDNLFLLSEYEIFGSITYAQDGINEGTQYAYWVGNNDRIKYYDNAGTPTATRWWERSSGRGTTSYFGVIYTSGGATDGVASNLRGVSFAFCV